MKKPNNRKKSKMVFLPMVEYPEENSVHINWPLSRAPKVEHELDHILKAFDLKPETFFFQLNGSPISGESRLSSRLPLLVMTPLFERRNRWVT